MANTVSINRSFWDGTRGALHYNLSSDGTALSDLSLIDISGLGGTGNGPTNIKIRTIQATLYGNFILTLEFDATTDETIAVIENQTADVSFKYVVDYTDGPNKGWTSTDIAAVGWVGDLFATSSGLASGDGFDLVVTFEKGT